MVHVSQGSLGEVVGYAKRAAFALMFVVNIGLTVGLLYLYNATGYYGGAAVSGVEIITIVLTAVAILVTTLGIFIAIMAIWGYHSLHNIAKETAERVAKERAETIATRAATDIVTRLDAGAYEFGEALDRDYGRAAGKENGNEN